MTTNEDLINEMIATKEAINKCDEIRFSSTASTLEKELACEFKIELRIKYELLNKKYNDATRKN